MIVKDVEVDGEGRKTYIFGIDERYEYLKEAVLTMCNAMDNELTGEILRELMRAKERIEEWERA